MHELTTTELAELGGREYIAEVKARLRDDEAWSVVCDPTLEARTRWALTRMIDSLDGQMARITDDEVWTTRAMSLRRYASVRLEGMAAGTMSNRKEARAWKAFATTLAVVLEKSDPDALASIHVPFGGLNAADWLDSRREKGHL